MEDTDKPTLTFIPARQVKLRTTEPKPKKEDRTPEIIHIPRPLQQIKES